MRTIDHIHSAPVIRNTTEPSTSKGGRKAGSRRGPRFVGKGARASSCSTVESPQKIVERALCNACGFDLTTTRPDDAVGMLLEFPGRYRELLMGDGRIEHNSELQARSQPSDWSAIEYTAHVAEVLHATSKRLILVFDRDERELPPHVEAVSAAARTAGPQIVLASLGAAVADLARIVNAARPDAWKLSAKHGDRTVTASELLCKALHEAHHHLGDAATALRAATSTASWCPAA